MYMYTVSIPMYVYLSAYLYVIKIVYHLAFS